MFFFLARRGRTGTIDITDLQQFFKTERHDIHSVTIDDTSPSASSQESDGSSSRSFKESTFYFHLILFILLFIMSMKCKVYLNL